MSLIAKENTSEKQLVEIPEGEHEAVCVGVVDLGWHPNEYQGEKRPDCERVALMFELPGITREWQGEQKPIRKTHTFRNSLHERAKLRKFLQHWKGESLKADELLGYKLEQLVGKNAKLQYLAGKEGKVFLDGIRKFEEGKHKPTDTIIYDISTHPTNFEKVPSWMQEEITTSIRFATDAPDTPVKDDDEVPF